MSYRDDLYLKKTAIKHVIAEKEKEVAANTRSPNFIELYRELNNLRVDLITVQSRIDHLDDTGYYQPERTLPKDINK